MFARLTGCDIRQRLDRDAAALTPPSPGSAVSQEQVASLPETVQRYFRFTDVVGKPAVSSFRAHLSGRFRLRRGQQFMPVEVWQYNAVAPIARLFWMLAELPLALSTHRPSIRRLGVVENCEQEPPHSWVLAQHTLSPRVVRAIHLASQAMVRWAGRRGLSRRLRSTTCASRASSPGYVRIARTRLSTWGKVSLIGRQESSGTVAAPPRPLALNEGPPSWRVRS